MFILENDSSNTLSIVVSILATIIYFAAIVLIIFFIVKIVKYFKRQEVLRKEIIEKLNKIIGVENEKNRDEKQEKKNVSRKS